jgi:hypothetical protein
MRRNFDQSDLQMARSLIASGKTDALIIAELHHHGLEKSTASELVRDIRLGKTLRAAPLASPKQSRLTASQVFFWLPNEALRQHWKLSMLVYVTLVAGINVLGAGKLSSVGKQGTLIILLCPFITFFATPVVGPILHICCNLFTENKAVRRKRYWGLAALASSVVVFAGSMLGGGVAGMLPLYLFGFALSLFASGLGLLLYAEAGAGVFLYFYLAFIFFASLAVWLIIEL